MSKKQILIIGNAGQGIQWLGKKIAEEFLVGNPKAFATYLAEYGAGNRTGTSVAQVILSSKSIKSPFILKPDILIDLKDKKIKYKNKVIKLEEKNRLNEEALKQFRRLIINN